MTSERAVIGVGLGAAIRRRRAALGLSTARLAEEIGVRPSDIGRWERGEDAPPPARVHALARALRVDTETARLWLDVASAEAGHPEVKVVIDLAPPDPFVLITHHATPDPVVPKPKERVAAPRPASSNGHARRPVQSTRPVPSVFPNPPGASLERDRHVYSATAGVRPPEHPTLSTAGRLVRVCVGLAALAVAFLWALGQLGDGFGDLIDLFKGSGAGSGG